MTDAVAEANETASVVVHESIDQEVDLLASRMKTRHDISGANALAIIIAVSASALAGAGGRRVHLVAAWMRALAAQAETENDTPENAAAQDECERTCKALLDACEAHARGGGTA